jgi:hypothetical protein
MVVAGRRRGHRAATPSSESGGDPMAVAAVRGEAAAVPGTLLCAVVDDDASENTMLLGVQLSESGSGSGSCSRTPAPRAARAPSGGWPGSTRLAHELETQTPVPVVIAPPRRRKRQR